MSNYNRPMGKQVLGDNTNFTNNMNPPSNFYKKGESCSRKPQLISKKTQWPKMEIITRMGKLHLSMSTAMTFSNRVKFPSR